MDTNVQVIHRKSYTIDVPDDHPRKIDLYMLMDLLLSCGEGSSQVYKGGVCYMVSVLDPAFLWGVTIGKPDEKYVLLDDYLQELLTVP